MQYVFTKNMEIKFYIHIYIKFLKNHIDNSDSWNKIVIVYYK